MSTIKTPVELLDEAVHSINSDLDLVKRRKAILKNGKTRTMLSRLLHPLVYAVGEAGEIVVHVFAGKPSISVRMYNLDSMKQRELVWAIEHLSNETDKLEGTFHTQDYAEAINRDFRFYTDKWDALITAYVKSDSPTCRKVVISTETVEKHKYQIVCD
jgi:hypothetical protein